MLKKITVFLCSATLAFSANAFDPASKSISVVIPFAPGGGVDQTFRHFEKWAANKNIKLNPIYKPGAEGLVGMNEIASMPRDGYHISFGTAGTIAVQRIKNPSAELELITGIKNSITAFITHKDSGITAIRDLEKVDNLTLAVGAPGQKMSMEQLLELSNGKIKGKLIPYKGGGPVVQDVLGNHVKLGAVPLQIVKSQIDVGTIRLLAVGTRTRVSVFKDTPTIFELFPGWKDNDGFAVIMPKGSDPAAVKFWTALIKDYMDDKEVQRDFVKDFNEPMLFGKTELEKIVNNAVKALSKN